MSIVEKLKNKLANKNPEKPNLVEEFQTLKREFQELERDEKQLKDYLNINVFDYAQDSQKIEDVFSIKNSSMAFLEKEAITKKLNPNIPVIEVNNLTKYYSSRKIPSLINVTLKIYLGDFHVIVGASGSGKSTLFNCLKGIEDYEGEVIIDGKELSAHIDFFSEDVVSFVNHEFGWDNYSTVSDLIIDRFKELNRTEIESQNYIRSSLETFGLSHLRYCPVIELSLPEKRKIQIIIALITDPHVVVFDEILLGLQQHEILDMFSIFEKLKTEDRSILLFTHAFNGITRFANVITILSEGKIYFSGPTDQLFISKVNNYVVSTEDNEKVTKDILSKYGDRVSFDYKEKLNLIVIKFDSKLTVQEFQKDCANEGIIIQEFRAQEISLEDLFPILETKGNHCAIKEINVINYFSPE